ncbi:hypothetical protein CYLTODRAFT_442392 [Cylindrobasidium torrendii FP15055 ss-10]|uniref:DUF4185 domain-containing protein n=1 Tax=Cylindrobasidium torrendii FP15055 ss-10 TaxID=1314674 RepID=A0A0D7BJT2_9AGAR|nr:hypothetical protein CYLTODRAFT_442392 [Cylindrobasidium torrendii FP15055 ss-10]
MPVILLLSFVSLVSTSALRAVSTPTFNVTELGQATDPDFPYVYRDGGVGGTINGKNIIVFSDTTTTDADGNMRYFTSNTAAFFDTTAPTQLTDFGNDGIPNLAIPFTASETAYTDEHFPVDGSRVACWPGSSITHVGDGSSGIAIYSMSIIDNTGSATEIYPTLATVTASDDGPAITRTVPQLIFPSGATSYGTFASVKNPDDNRLYLFGKTDTGLLMARVNEDKVADVSQYQYYSGASAGWTSTPPSTTNPDAYVLKALYSSGDIFYSSYLNTWIFIYFNGYADSTFYVRYTVDGSLEGEWSDEQVLYKTTPSTSVYNYGAHAFSAQDASGQSLVLSWTESGTTIKMARVQIGKE